MVELKSKKAENSSKESENPSESMQVENESNRVFNIEILRIIKEFQQQHGLRHGDYQRYRGYCSRRIKRLRKTLNIPQGDKRHYRKRDVTTVNLEKVNADERLIHIPLMLAERAWAYGMQLRQESNTELRKKFHLIGKLRKACVYALQLQELCNSQYCDARTKLEAEAYCAWIHGSLHFELSLWKSAAENLKKAQVVYENLALALPEEEQIIYKSKCDELTPSLRYCAYNIGENTSMDDLLEMRAQGLTENLGALIVQTKTESMEAFQTTEWRGRKVTVRSEKVRLFLLSIQDLEKSVEKVKTFPAKIEILENVLLDCKDAISVIKDEIKQDPKLRMGAESGLTGIQYLLTYLSYIRLTLTLKRNLFLVAQGKKNLDEQSTSISTTGGGDGKKTKPQDISRLYEIILQNVSELQQLPGMESDKTYQSEIDTLSLTFKSFRCYYIAITLVHLKRWKEAVAMYERSTKYAKDALDSKSILPEFNLTVELNELIKTIEGCKFSAHAYSVLEEDTGEDSVLYGKTQKSSKPLFERLSQYKEDAALNSRNPNVFKLTPDMQPIPCKPLFFDLALNFVEFPSLEDKIEVSNKQKAAGISGFVKGFLGWGGNKQ
uniref:Signal recognition particle subunit SRP68 n=1 Tax=Corethrella appendiculata TaxID=1370023 RepID=U5EUQ1_9DIPT